MEIKFKVSYNEKYNCLIGKFYGELTPENINEYTQEIAKYAKINNCKRFLNDLREATIKFSVGEIFFAPPKVQYQEFDLSWKRAIIFNKNFNETAFLEITSKNQGILLKTFFEFNEAIEWLTDY